jgi:predicted Rossmann fold nucleotide-binding protein DprA/Smf involved in DNA uptake
MTLVSDDRLAALLLAQRLIGSEVSPLKASEYWTLLQAVPSPGILLGLNPAQVQELAGVDIELAQRVVVLLDQATAFAFRLDELEQSGIRAMSSIEGEYPERLRRRLGRGAPPILYFAGPAALLSSELLGIVGSRDVDPAGATTAQEAARIAVSHGSGVVSGGAKGVDRLAMNAALDAGGFVVGVLADSLQRTLRDADLRRTIVDEQACMCTPYVPTAGFSVASAMGRNKLIYALSNATLVVRADRETGGTWSGAVEAQRQGFAPVLVWTGDGGGDGNRALTKIGATAVPCLDRLYPMPERRENLDSEGEQLSLGL